jgi:hypothetical protein
VGLICLTGGLMLLVITISRKRRFA